MPVAGPPHLRTAVSPLPRLPMTLDMVSHPVKRSDPEVMKLMMQAPQPKDGGYLWLDPHILCTPALADIDGDGHEDLVIAATYFFDRDEYDSQVPAILCRECQLCLITLLTLQPLGCLVGNSWLGSDIHGVSYNTSIQQLSFLTHKSGCLLSWTGPVSQDFRHSSPTRLWQQA